MAVSPKPPSVWWYCSSPAISCAVEVREGIVTDGPPIVRGFVGRPAKTFGNWLRGQGEVSFYPLDRLSHVYVWGNNSKRETLKGRRCRVLIWGEVMRSVLVEFEDGQREVVSWRALRRKEAYDRDRTDVGRN